MRTFTLPKTALPAFRSLVGSAVAIATAVSAPVSAQRTDALVQTLATTQWLGEYVRVPSAVVSSDGLLIVESSEKQLIHLDNGRGSVSSLRDGEGPEEIRAIRSVVSYRGDSALVFGRAMTRAVVVTSAGVPVRTKVLTGFNTDSTWLFQLVGTGPAGELAFISPRRASGRRDSADVLLLDPTMAAARSIAALWYPPPAGLYESDDPPAAAAHDHDQVLLLPSGYLVFYHSSPVGLEVRRLATSDARRYPLPARDRPTSRAERRGLLAAAEQVAARRDSALASVPPETRKLLLSRLAAAGVGKIPERVSAYESNGLVALAGSVVAVERKQLIAMDRTTFDWLDVATGASGSFVLPSGVTIIGAGRDSVVLARRDTDGFVSVAAVPVHAFRTPRLPIEEIRP